MAQLGDRSAAKPQQTGTYYCSGCGRKFRYTHEGYAICLTKGCPHATKDSYQDDYDG